MNSFSKTFNITLQYIIESDLTRLMINFNEGQGDVMTTPAYPLYKRYKNRSFTYYTYSESKIVLPKAKRLSNIKKILMPYQEDVWYLLMAINILISILCIFIKFILKYSRAKEIIFNMTNLDIFGILMGVTVSVILKRNFFKCFFLSFLCFTFLIRKIYLGSLFKFIVSDLYDLKHVFVSFSYRIY